MRDSTKGWAADLTMRSPIPLSDSTNPNIEANLGILEDIVSTLVARGMLVVFVKFPESPQYAKTSFATRYGPEWPQYHRLMGRVRAWETTHPGFHLYDAHRDGLHDYPDSPAMNTDHLSLAGARQLSRRLDSLIASLR